MEMNQLIRLLPDMAMIEEAFLLAGWNVTSHISDPAQVYRHIRIFTGQQTLMPDIVYTLRQGEDAFPTDQFAYICTSPIPGSANHICCNDASAEAVLAFLLELYTTYHEQEMQINQLACRNGDLQELCQLGESLLGNPVCIHDDWFIVIGMSQSAAQIMVPEYPLSSTRCFLPQAILDDFKQDTDYLETYVQTVPSIWTAEPPAPSSLYVNLWDESIYRGRLVVTQSHRPIRKSDFIVAEVLAQRAIFLMQRTIPGEAQKMRSMDDVVFSLLSGKETDPADQLHLLRMLRWEKQDAFVCVRIASQMEGQGTVLDHVLHSDLFRCFPGSYVLLSKQEQCLILNLSRAQIAYSIIAHTLAPLCRDYCLYAGISSPVSGIQEWGSAYYQAGVALNKAFVLRSEKWIIPFSQCVLDHLLQNIIGPLQPSHLVSPELRLLAQYDKEKGTQYLQTFREYLLQERDIPRTAEKLIIHRTTLLYRLKKIQSLVPLNLDDPWIRLRLMTSLWILEQESAASMQ